MAFFLDSTSDMAFLNTLSGKPVLLWPYQRFVNAFRVLRYECNRAVQSNSSLTTPAPVVQPYSHSLIITTLPHVRKPSQLVR